MTDRCLQCGALMDRFWSMEMDQLCQRCKYGSRADVAWLLGIFLLLLGLAGGIAG